LQKLVPWDSASESDLDQIITIINDWRESVAIVIPTTPTSQQRARKKPRSGVEQPAVTLQPVFSAFPSRIPARQQQQPSFPGITYWLSQLWHILMVDLQMRTFFKCHVKHLINILHLYLIPLLSFCKLKLLHVQHLPQLLHMLVIILAQLLYPILCQPKFCMARHPLQHHTYNSILTTAFSLQLFHSGCRWQQHLLHLLIKYHQFSIHSCHIIPIHAIDNAIYSRISPVVYSPPPPSAPAPMSSLSSPWTSS